VGSPFKKQDGQQRKRRNRKNNDGIPAEPGREVILLFGYTGFLIVLGFCYGNTDGIALDSFVLPQNRVVISK
jgi:hypothetical protein